ncbi:MAG: bifunctional glutamate N-acetyltransferase/amino-acid acetyltransferase ArgJ [bacterium]|nr:bifunctional glutamate N-acetyltransferase/amino-acid acetyltransferase ArgJ [bacterium]
MEQFEGYTYIDGGVCAANGFKANGLNCGLNPVKEKFDLALVASDAVCNAAGVYTKNKVKAAPVYVTKSHIEVNCGRAQAVIANSKNANACNADGNEKAEAMCSLAARELGIDKSMVLVASTGVIGQPLPIEPIENNIKTLTEGLTYDGGGRAAYAIMTTDTVQKEVAVEFELGGIKCRLGGMAKGSGMIHPNMATTLNFITTDAAVSSELLQKALSDIVKVTYNCLSIDGDTSTNDMVILLANGLAENPPVNAEGEDYEVFKQALYIVMMNLTRMLASDGEGASKLIECTVSEAPDIDTAVIVAKSIIRSPLTKCAMFGEDANWGRILCAIGYSEAEFDINKIAVELASAAGCVKVCEDGHGIPFSEDDAAVVLHEKEIYINVSMGCGSAKAKAWGCDLTYDYVRINGDYRS